MSSLETSLRRALEKGDVSDPLYRRRVYEAAASTIHKSLQTRGLATDEAVSEQNKKLADAIRTIEVEIKASEAAQTKPAANAVREAPVAPPVANGQPSVRTREVAPVISAMREQLRENARRETQTDIKTAPGRQEPVLDTAPKVTTAPDVSTSKPQQASSGSAAAPAIAPEAQSLPPKVETADRRSRTKRDKDGVPIRKPFANFLAAAIGVALLVVGLMWVIETGAFQSAESRDTSVPTPEKTLESESFAGRAQGASDAPEKLGANDKNENDWVTLFKPSDPTTIGLVGGATATVESDPFGDYALLVASGPNAEVQIDIPLSVMLDAAKGPLQVSLVARSADNVQTQMSVTCDFGALGDCGRRRFNVGQAENEYIFQINKPGTNAIAPGILKIKTDLEGKGRGIKLLSARIRTTQ